MISNPHSHAVAFKIKTTAPKSFCVKPNSGFLPAGGKAEVLIMLQAMDEEPPLNAKCRDKFLVQSTPASSTAASPIEFWASVNKSEISEQKLRVAYLPPTSAAVPEEPEEEETKAKAAPKTATELEQENAQLRAQLKANASRVPKIALPLVALLLALVAAAAAAGTWYAITNDLLSDYIKI